MYIQYVKCLQMQTVNIFSFRLTRYKSGWIADKGIETEMWNKDTNEKHECLQLLLKW